MKIDPAQSRMAVELKHGAPLVSCRFDPSGRFVFAGSQDNSVQRWEVAKSKKTALAGHASWVRAIAATAKSKFTITGDYHGKVIVWPTEADQPKPSKTFAAHDGWLRALAVSADERLLATCGNDGLVKLWSLPEAKLIRTLAGHGCHVYQVAFSSAGALASCDLKGVVKLWDTNKGTVVREMSGAALYKYDQGFRADIGGARGMTFTADGKTLAISGITDVSNAFAGVGKPIVLLFDVATGKIKHTLRPKEAFQGTAWGVAIHPEGYVIAAGGGNGGALWFWKLDTGAFVFTLKLPNNARDLALSPDGTRVAIPFFDGVVRVYDMTAKAKKP